VKLDFRNPAFLAACAGGSPRIVLADCDAYWRFNESSGDPVDATGNGHDLDNDGGTYFAGKFNNAINVAPASSGLNGTLPAMADGDSFTFFGWWAGSGDTLEGRRLVVLGEEDGLGGSPIFYVYTEYQAPTWYLRVFISSGVIPGGNGPARIASQWFTTDWRFLAFGYDAATDKLWFRINDTRTEVTPNWYGLTFDDFTSIIDLSNESEGAWDAVGFAKRTLSDAELASVFLEGSGREL
jgi:hypothetical protein